MDFLKIPELFKGEWENLLIMTYGAEIPFFENSLWRQFSNRCRNKIILADAKEHLNSCRQYADNGLARLLNQRYVVDGIFVPQAAHAKFILLTNREKGRLLVGSGNLGLDGYASGGELFTHYEYSDKSPEALPAFLGIWEFVETFISKGYISGSSLPYLQHMHTRTPWLFQTAKSSLDQVRHNLTKSFLSQIQEAVGSEAVEELWIASPFYDEKAHGLKQLINALSPKTLNILVQLERTSLDPEALLKVLDGNTGQSNIYTFDLKDNTSTYVHAKLYLVKTKTRSICLQGSPNLSQVAMLLTPPTGNIELANLSTGGRDEFDYLLDNLAIYPISDPINTLSLSYNKPDRSENEIVSGWHLTGGAWQENKLLLRFRGNLPDLSDIVLRVGSDVFTVKVSKTWEGALEILLPNEARALLSSPCPVSLVFKDGLESNPVFVNNTAALNREMLDISEEETQIGRIGDLDLEDEELAILLGELESSLVLDTRSVWQPAGRSLPKFVDDEEDLRLDYADVDYEQLKRHPKILSYLSSVGLHGQPNTVRSRLQEILSAITDHFNGLVSIATGTNALNIVTDTIDEAIAETEEEREEEETEVQIHKKSSSARIRQIVKNFIKRYIRGIKSPDFQELTGFQVMGTNYIIFSHLLWRLFAKEWVEPEFLLESYIQIWRFFWGDSKQKGYFSILDDTERQQLRQMMQQQKNKGLFLAALHYGAYLSFVEGHEDLRFSLRNFLRDFLTKEPFVIDNTVVEEAWVYTGSLFPYNPPIPSRIIDDLMRLANYENQRGFLRSVEQKGDFKEGSCLFMKQEVFRRHLNASASVDCLVIKDPKAIQTLDEALLIVAEWQKYSQRDYYRIISGDSTRIFFFDAKAKDGIFYQKETNEMTTIDELPRWSQAPYEQKLAQVMACALDVDNLITFKTNTKKVNSL